MGHRSSPYQPAPGHGTPPILAAAAQRASADAALPRSPPVSSVNRDVLCGAFRGRLLAQSSQLFPDQASILAVFPEIGENHQYRSVLVEFAQSHIGGHPIRPSGDIVIHTGSPTPRPWLIQRLAEGELLSGWQLATMLYEVFQESEFSKASGRPVWSSRCTEAGAPWMATHIQLDETVPVHPPTKMPPRKAISTLHAVPLALLKEKGLRVMLVRIRGSWKSVSSGLSAWGAFQDARQRSPHFPGDTATVLSFSSAFQCGGTLGNYLSAVRWGHLLQNLPITWEVAGGSEEGPIEQGPTKTV